MDQFEIKKCDILLYHQNWNTSFWRCTFTNFGTYPEHWENRLRLLYKTTIQYKGEHFRPSSYKKPLIITYKKTFS